MVEKIVYNEGFCEEKWKDPTDLQKEILSEAESSNDSIIDKMFRVFPSILGIILLGIFWFELISWIITDFSGFVSVLEEDVFSSIVFILLLIFICRLMITLLCDLYIEFKIEPKHTHLLTTGSFKVMDVENVSWYQTTQMNGISDITFEAEINDNESYEFDTEDVIIADHIDDKLKFDGAFLVKTEVETAMSKKKIEKIKLCLY